MVSVQSGKRKGLAGHLPRDHVSFPGREQTSIFIPARPVTVSQVISGKNSECWEETERGSGQRKVEKYPPFPFPQGAVSGLL